jgi:hypothetical protein
MFDNLKRENFELKLRLFHLQDRVCVSFLCDKFSRFFFFSKHFISVLLFEIEINIIIYRNQN